MAHFVFTCPATSIKVQHWLDDDEDVPENEYAAVTCKACARSHLINRKTGRLLGQE
jgi:predicted nucleic-acid-binding Zn-ribbon protein